jgi:uracil-DNA glycosylase
MLDHSAVAAGWRPLVDAFFAGVQGRALEKFLEARRDAGAGIYPPTPFTALELTPPETVRVVILGQDPYHGAGQAHGLAFSVRAGVKPPPSLRNLFLELQGDCGCAAPANGDLSHWARQGVLLLNAVLTVEAGAPASHSRRGWEALTDQLIEALARDPQPKVFLLWGTHAQAKAASIEAAGHRHLVLSANHPSPLSARRPPVPFLGCRHFSAANTFLASHGRGTVNWCAASGIASQAG